ncbi:hypothetical protein AVEN_179306-1 [Araneus ventricosus]|uniref:Peptidase aspartic putative domain-containing protein n=1 Tax=Araneus ventricosus TaxID=182803 RepID=A0A4Y2TZE8_ARAVE|nr:hypothetical protein AVEN_179306-1 [Araneus ventricosus]
MPKINDRIILRELKFRKIEITDSVSGEYEIDLLICTDLLGSLLTEEIVELDCGLTAVHTKLGWTIMGTQKRTSSMGNVMTTLSMHCRSVNLTEMWDLECLGMIDPSQSLFRKKAHSEHLNDFREKLSILPCGRYEVGLPSKSDSRNLRDNKELSWERHEKMVKRMKARGFLCDYQEIFDDWERLKIIERVPENELKNEKCHYLPHRPVIKMQIETIKIRPVFDASASEKGKPSLNHCLFKGINLIEPIPDVIDRFRTYLIGLSGDIEKAFLLLSVANQDREFLRFFYPCDEELIYRHCRVVLWGIL